MDGFGGDGHAAQAEGITRGVLSPSKVVLARRHPRVGLRAVLATAFGGLALLAALAASLTVGAVADRRLRADIGAEFGAAAERAADLLDRGLFERLRDLQVAAALDVMRDPATAPASRRTVLRRMQETYPDYAILFFVSPEGRIIATDTGALEGVDVSRREYFLRGRDGPFVGEVHDGPLMAKVLGLPPENPPRFVDIAAPVHAPDGTLLGIVAAHLYWHWAEGIERDVMASIDARHPDAEALVVSRDGQVLIGPPGLMGVNLQSLAPGVAASLASRQGGSAVATDAAGGTYLLGYAPTHGHRAYMGLGWSVLVRHDARAAFAPARALAREVLFWGIGAALLAAALGWYLAGLIARPLVELCGTARELENDPWAAVPAGRGPREVSSLAAALAGLVAAVRAREQSLRAGAARLRLATEGAGIGAWDLDLATGLCIRSPRYDAILGQEAPPAEWRFADFLHRIPPEDRDAVARGFEAAIAAGVEWRTECRVQRGDGSGMRWVAVRGAPVADPATGAVHHYAGVIEDVTDRKSGERAQELLVRELDHRVKNQFAVFDGLVQFTARAARDARSMAEALRGRVRALAAAHDLVREASGSGAARGLRPTTLPALTEAVLGPFGTGGAGRIEACGPATVVGPTAAGALALALHEMATNAARHGALSRPEGHVLVAWDAGAGGAIRLRWLESGGPAVPGEPERRGFGSTLIRQSVEHQLGGRVAFDWERAEGLALALEVPGERLGR